MNENIEAQNAAQHDEAVRESVAQARGETPAMPDAPDDSTAGAVIGATGGALVGAAAGSIVGPAGTVIGAVVGALTGAGASGLAVGAIEDAENAPDKGTPIV